MINKFKHKRKFYGTTNLSEKGQVVIPLEARVALNIKKGEKLLVFSLDHDVLAFTKLAKVEEFARHLSEKLTALKRVIKKNRSKK